MSNLRYGTKMKRKEPFEADSEWAPYNEILIVGNSAVSESIRDSEWQGQAGESLTIQPLASFGSTIDRPRGEIERDWQVTEFPPEPVPSQLTRQPGEANKEEGPSPEEYFRIAREKETNEPPSKTTGKEKASKTTESGSDT